MKDDKRSIAQACFDAADSGAMTFPEIFTTLMKEGFESYLIDFRRATATYYLSDGKVVELTAHPIDTVIAPTFDKARIQAAIREAQQLTPGYTYRGFCQKVAAAGCAAYLVSFSGRRALYIGRTGETHVEHFPD